MKRWILALVMLGLSVVPALAETAVTTGMGYKKMLSELCALYKQESGKQLTEVYSGTIGQSLAQYKAGSGVSVFVSDRQTLEDSDVSFASFQPLGTAVLVLAWKKGLNVESPQDLQSPKIRSIGYPDKKGAIYGKANAIASSADKTFSYIPDCSDLPISEDADYVYICHNNTIYGTTYKKLPNTKGKILVADMSSDILSQPVNVSDYGLIYFGVQKNVGPAGVVVVIIREDLIRDDVPTYCPTMLKYKTQADNDSLYNTPPCYGIYICGLVFKWVKEMGGLSAMKIHNEKKAAILYDFLDSSKMFHGTVVKEDRSLMNVPFVTGNEELDAKFVKEATAAGFVNLKGHRTVGGMRASIYNAMPIEGVEKLVAFMKDFEEKNS